MMWILRYSHWRRGCLAIRFFPTRSSTPPQRLGFIPIGGFGDGGLDCFGASIQTE